MNWLAAAFHSIMRLTQFFKDDSGNFSGLRLVFISWGYGVLVVWCITSLRAGVPQPIDEWVAFILGALAGSKVWQKFPESKK